MGYRKGRSTSSRDARSAIAMRFIDEYFSLFAAWSIFRHIYFCGARTTMTSEASENTIFRSVPLHHMLSYANQVVVHLACIPFFMQLRCLQFYKFSTTKELNWNLPPHPPPPRLRPNFGAVANQTCVSLKNNSKYQNRVSTKKRASNAVIKAYVLFYIHQTPGECEWRQFELNVYRYNKQVTQLFNNTQLTG